MTHNPSEHSYRDFLLKEYFLRRNKNSSYSLRAFANHIQLSPGFLSLLLNGKKNISLNTAGKIASNLKWTVEQKKYFLNLIEIENPRSDHSYKLALEQVKAAGKNVFIYDHFDTDIFAQMAEWQHTAILVLLTLKNIKHTTEIIGKKLGLTSDEVKKALNRLERLGFITKKDTEWKSSKPFFKLPSAPSAAIRTYHRQVLKLADKAIQQQSFETRDFSNVTFTVAPEKIELAKEKIAQFRQELAELLDCDKATEVYQLSIQLFKMTHSQEEKHV